MDSSRRFDWRLRSYSRLPLHRRNGIDYLPRSWSDWDWHTLPPLSGETIDAYKKYNDLFSPLIAAEQAEGFAKIVQRLVSWSVERLKKEGYCVTGLSASFRRPDRFGRQVVSFCLGEGIPLPPHRFQVGTQAMVSRQNPLMGYKGTIIACHDTQLLVAFWVKEESLSVGKWRLDVGQPSTVFDRMRIALKHISYDLNAQDFIFRICGNEHIPLRGSFLSTCILQSFHSGIWPDPILPASETKGEFLGINATPVTQGPLGSDMRIQSWATRYDQSDPLVVEGDPHLDRLGPSQLRAIAVMLKNRVSLVQGPPGTGKTKVIVEALKLLKVFFEVPHPILLCTFTNVAIDHIVNRLASAGVKPVRIGFGARDKSTADNYTLERKMMQHHLHREYRRLKALRRLSRHRLQVSRAQSMDMRNICDELLDEIALRILETRSNTLKSRIVRDVLADADVICTTCFTAGSSQLEGFDFPIVFIDEAAMCTEPASLIPSMKGSSHIVLVGDHRQLQAVVSSHTAKTGGLGLSLFERLSRISSIPSTMLDTQYRMHPDISTFPSKEFYGAALKDGTLDQDGNAFPHLSAPVSSFSEIIQPDGRYLHVLFLDHGGSGGYETKRDSSYENIQEAKIICSVIEDLLIRNPDIHGRDVGIISPYVCQRTLLSKHLHGTFVPPRFATTLGDRKSGLQDIEIKTVDGFQGREKEVIIFSTVRNQIHGPMNFIADERRLNVGLTRAKRGLIIVGNSDFLSSGSNGDGQVLARYAHFLKDRKYVLKLDDGLLRKVLDGNIGRR